MASNTQTIPVNETRTEVAALLFPDMGNWCPVSPLCVRIPLRLREIIVPRQDWLLGKDKTRNSSVQEEKKHTSWHTIKCILSSCSEGGGGGWVLIIQAMKTIKSDRNTGEILFRQGLWRRGSAHTYTLWESCTCTCIPHNWDEDHNYEWDSLSSPTYVLSVCFPATTSVTGLHKSSFN